MEDVVRISLRLALVFLAVVFTGMVAQTALSVRWHAALYRAEAIRDLRTMGRTLAPVVAAVIRTHGAERTGELVEEANAGIESTRVQWVGAASSIDELPPIHGDRVERALASGELIADGDENGADSVHLYQRVRLGDEVVGLLYLSEPVVGRTELLMRRLASLSALATTLAAACGFVAWLVSRRWVEQPVEELIDGARRIGAEDFSSAVELKRHREFSVLAAEMNATARKLAAARQRVADETAARIAALEQLRHADRLTTVGRLAAGIAHELGTPLNVVSERAEMIARGELETTEGVVQSARVIQQQSARMADSVRRLLDFARRRKPDRSIVQLGDLARSTCRLVAPLLERRGVEVRIIDPPEAIVCEVDPDQLQQVLVNLLTNAVDVSSPRGEVRIRIEATHETPAAGAGRTRWAYIAVEDDGPGIPPESLPRIFEPFFTTKPAGQGTGLGLAIAQEIMREHGGSLEMRSVVGRGSEIRMWIPREAA
jgi:signal transduction histidine kinase